MEKFDKKQSRFFCGDKKDLLQLLCLFPDHTVCNSYMELSPYYPCLFLGEIFKDIAFKDTVFFIITDRKVNENFLYVTENKLKEILCDFFGYKPPFKSNEPFLSLIYKYSIFQGDVKCMIPLQDANAMTSILKSMSEINYIDFLDEKKKLLWLFVLKKIKYSFLKTGNQSLGNYVILLKEILREALN